MSRDVFRDKSNRLVRSNSDIHISLNHLSTVNHSKTRLHGPRHSDSDTRDNVSIQSSSSVQIASSPYQSASSALAVLNTLPLNPRVILDRLVDQPSVTTLSIAEQQPTIAYTEDLSLPINFLPGEDDVKLREDVTFLDQKTKVLYHGELIVTKYRLLCITKSSHPVEILVNVPLGMINQIRKVGGRTLPNRKSEGTTYGIEITCKDLQYFFFGCDKEQHQRRNLYEHLYRMIYPFSFNKLDLTKPSQFFSSFFAWNYKKKICPNTIDKGWTVYNKIKDYTRMGITRTGESPWTINTEINKTYGLCETYPDTLVLPSSFNISRIRHVAGFRTKQRLPVLSWYSRETYATITRASQPTTGLNRKCQDDIDYLQHIAEANVNQGARLFILDARPKLNAIANKAKGGGYEDYSDCELEFQNIKNIHSMRESWNNLHSATRGYSQNSKTWLNDIEASHWLSHIGGILTVTNRLVFLIHNENQSTLVHCSDGWDRTAQLTSLAMLMLDGYYRTLNGLIVLIEKEWISFGHKFLCRIGHGDKNESERSPVFLQFLDCTYQLLQQFASAFEFNENLLLTIADSLYSCQYGTFLLDSERSRTQMRISEYTMSAWTPILDDRQSYLNPSYNANFGPILQVNTSSNQIKLWKNYYCRYMLD